MSGVKHTSMPIKLFSPCLRTLPGEGFRWAEYSAVSGQCCRSKARLIREVCVGTPTGIPPGKTAAMDLRCSPILLLQQKDFLP